MLCLAGLAEHCPPGVPSPTPCAELPGGGCSCCAQDAEVVAEQEGSCSTRSSKKLRKMSIFSVTDANITPSFARGTFWPRGVCDLSHTDMGRGGGEPKQMKQERWYKDNHMGLILQGHEASCSVFPHWFQRDPCVLQHLVGSDSGLIYFSYLTCFFLLPVFFMLLLRGGKMTHPHQALGASLPTSVSTHYIQSKKRLFQQLETKRTKWEPNSLHPEAEGGGWYSSTTPLTWTRFLSTWERLLWIYINA